MDFSVVILTYNSKRYIETCLQSAIDSFNQIHAQFEIFVTDNGSQDGTVDILERFESDYPNQIRVSYFKENTGTTYSRNIGLTNAQGEHIIVLDSDAYLNPDVVSGIRDYLVSTPHCGLAVPTLTYPDGRAQLSTDVFPTLVRKVQRFLYLKDIEQTLESKTEPHAVDYAISAFWMFPRHVLNAVGLLDEKIFYSPEDVDYCIRIWKAGFEIHFVPEFSTVHDAQEISRAKGFSINWFTLSHLKGLFYLFLKHRFIFSSRRLKRSFKVLSS